MGSFGESYFWGFYGLDEFILRLFILGFGLDGGYFVFEGFGIREGE